ncbi:MAG: radical SAM family heme chaperone HemW [Christensenellales bacterium]
MITDSPRGLYLHIPFCLSKCHYCDFFSVSASDEVIKQYTDACVKEMQAHPLRHTPIDTIYLGGGTPSLLPISLIERLLYAVFSDFAVNPIEVTIEVNPCSGADVRLYKELGINRLSVGVQSLNDKILAALGRRHTAGEALAMLERAKACFDNISCDLMLAVPYQSEEDIIGDINTLSNYASHFSAYLLKTETGTLMDKWIKEGRFAQVLADEDKAADYYLLAVSELQRQGYQRYETSNFALPGFESKHNLKYWQGKQYLGIGAGAHSYTQGKRYCIPPDINGYIAAVNEGKDPRVLIETPDTAELIKERIMLSLRLAQGLDIATFNKEFSLDFLDIFGATVKKLSRFVQVKNGFLSLTGDGFLLQNSIIAEFFSAPYFEK